MNTSRTRVVIAICFLALVHCSRAEADSQAGQNSTDALLHVHLPREVTIEGSSLRLGQIGIVRGNRSLVAKAGTIPLGRISTPGQEIVVDRAIILSRLACNGIPASEVTVTGAKRTTIKQQHQIIKGAQFVELAQSSLKKNMPAESEYEAEPVRVPKDLMLPEPSEDLAVRSCLVDTGTANRAKVRITVSAHGDRIATRDVVLALKYRSHKVVASTEIPAGTVIGPQNVKIQETLSDSPEPANWRPPYGLVARRRIPPNTVLSPNMVGPLRSAVTVERNDTVVIQIKRPGFSVTTLGIALQKGRAGEYIKVRNAESQRIILCKVNEDGNVEPVL